MCDVDAAIAADIPVETIFVAIVGIEILGQTRIEVQRMPAPVRLHRHPRRQGRDEIVGLTHIGRIDIVVEGARHRGFREDRETARADANGVVAGTRTLSDADAAFIDSLVLRRRDSDRYGMERHCGYSHHERLGQI